MKNHGWFGDSRSQVLAFRAGEDFDVVMSLQVTVSGQGVPNVLSFANLRWALAGLVLAVMLSGCVSRMKSDGSPTGGRMAELTAKRLSLAPEVAWYKFREGLPVYDRKREADSLARLVEQGKALGIPSGEVKSFFGAQMAASRSVQKRLIAQWKNGGQLPTAPPRDLVKGIRPELDVLNAEILAEMARTARRGS